MQGVAVNQRRAGEGGQRRGNGVEGGTGGAAQSALAVEHGAVERRRDQRREVLQVVGAAIGVGRRAAVVRRHLVGRLGGTMLVYAQQAGVEDSVAAEVVSDA